MPDTSAIDFSENFLSDLLSTPLPVLRDVVVITPAAGALDAVEALRQATQALHERLDNRLPLSRAAPSLADYALHLCVLRDWQVALAPWLSRTGSVAATLMHLKDDIADCAPCVFSAAYLQFADADLVVQADDGSDAFCWGIAYVLEGSRLGGQVLYKRLQAHLAPHPLRYLQRGTEGPSWPQTLKALRMHVATAPSRAAACAGAVAAFELLLVRFELAGAPA